MGENIQRSGGRQEQYKLDRGGVIADAGPFIGEVMNNVDPTFTGRLQVYIEAFGQGDPTDERLWRTVRYMTPFYGKTNPRASNDFSPGSGFGSYLTNPQSYGMWFTPPDIGVEVLCFFVEGDPSRGFYVGCIPQPATTRMIPAIGAVNNFEASASEQQLFSKSKALPVTEVNTWNQGIMSDPKVTKVKKPVHSYVAAAMFQQGVINDVQRGPISSSSQRETPSNAYGIITPGRAIYNGGLQPETIEQQLNSGALKPNDVKVIGRQGGHSLVMDDGDLTGTDALIRIRTAKGHQIMMNDQGNFVQILTANGQAWIELGVEGTVDVYATYSVNIRTEGTLNLHADKNINIYAGGTLNVKSKEAMNFETEAALALTGTKNLQIYSQATLDVKADGSLALQSADGAWSASGLKLQAGRIDLNSGGGRKPGKPTPIKKTVLDDTKFNENQGWQVQKNALNSIVTRAPTHEPYPWHGYGTSDAKNLGN